MFYTHLFTSTRGPLAKIWLAAHWERKLTKAQVSECNLETVIEDIIPKMKIGLRTSGHLLIGVVRIYARKAKYLLADCSEALIKVKNAFRPGDESQFSHPGLLDMSLQSLSHQGDAFGDEDRGCDLLDFLTNPSDEAVLTDFITAEAQREKPTTPALSHSQGAPQAQRETPALGETAREHGFALEPVPITPNLEKKRGKRKRKLLVDLNKELSDADIREQISHSSDLVVAMDLAPPTLQLMLWKENGGAHRLFARPCSCVIAPQVIELFSICGKPGVSAEVEVMRRDRRDGRGDSGAVLTTDTISLVDSSLATDLTRLSHMTGPLDRSSSCMQMENRSASAQPELPSEDSMLVHQSLAEEEMHVSFSNTRSAEDVQVFEDGNINRHAQTLLDFLKSDGQASFSLKSLCDGVTRSQAATTFFCLLVLSKQQSLHLQQDAPYEDVLVTPGPML
ncbi:unnamed protein product [Tetraodon nigroviridis]|uniref:(spotted green pufferfish) hypothetical protein n=1 Tax=Tetraodon nigroviridis TaxID=99883 RepID=Q4S609_TETNG|nr:unnamed protein product [Tetraodon nigroviridis]